MLLYISSRRCRDRAIGAAHYPRVSSTHLFASGMVQAESGTSNGGGALLPVRGREVRFSYNSPTLALQSTEAGLHDPDRVVTVE